MNLNQRAFDAVKMPVEHQSRIRAALSAHLSSAQREEQTMYQKHRPAKATRILLVAVTAALAVSLMGFTWGPQIISLLGGGRVISGVDVGGSSFVSMDTGFATDPVEVRDGRTYFVLDGSETDITAFCSETTSYRYESTAEDGSRHMVLIGGTPEAPAWAEFVWDKDGTLLGTNATYHGDSEPAWLTAARAELDPKWSVANDLPPDTN